MRRRSMLIFVFYGGLGLLVAGILLDVRPEAVPASVTARLRHNSEGLVLALLLAPWIQFVRPRLAGRRWEWHLTLVLAAVCAGGGALLLASDLPSRFRTLNETFLALALLLPYVQPRRPIPRWEPAAVSCAALAAILLGLRVDQLVDAAETLAVLVLTPVAVDLADRRVLDPDASDDGRARTLWFALLVTAPVAISLTAQGTYLSRTTEAFVFLLAIEVYLAAHRAVSVPTSVPAHAWTPSTTPYRRAGPAPMIAPGAPTPRIARRRTTARPRHAATRPSIVRLDRAQEREFDRNSPGNG